jgi:hypothetical protein
MSDVKRRARALLVRAERLRARLQRERRAAKARALLAGAIRELRRDLARAAAQ